MVKEEKQENRVMLNFMYLELQKKRFFIEKRSTKTFRKTSMFAGLFCKDKKIRYKKLTGQ